MTHSSLQRNPNGGAIYGSIVEDFWKIDTGLSTLERSESGSQLTKDVAKQAVHRTMEDFFTPA